MQLIEVPAKTGYAWYRQGLWLFRRNPLAFLTIFSTYLLAVWLVSKIPLVGGVLPLVFIPGVAAGFMAACRDTVAGKAVSPTVLIDGFRSYGGLAARRLLELGALYVVAIVLVFGASALVDGGSLFTLILGAADTTPPAPGPETPLGGLVALACYVPVAMLFWFSPVLAAWHDVPPVKAMFFSVVSCWRNRGAFIVFTALWFATMTVISVLVSLVMVALGAGAFVFVALFPATITMITMLYCSFYATYRGCFGAEEPRVVNDNGAPGPGPR